MPNVRDEIKGLLAKDDFDIYMNLLNNDVSAHRLEAQKKEQIVVKSMETAKLLYDNLVKEFGEGDIYKYVYASKVPINYVKEKPTKYYAYIGLFSEETKTITINLETIMLIKKTAESMNIDDLVAINPIKDVVVAHEFFHYLEMINPDIYTNQKIIEGKIIGIFKTKSQLLAAGEIAAIHFSKLVTKLPHTPLVYNKIFSVGKKLTIH